MPKYVLTSNFYKIDKKNQATFFKLITTKSKHSIQKDNNHGITKNEQKKV